jgi:hypothetical protein
LEILLVGKEYLEPQSVPQELDYDFWLGPAPYKPYNAHRVHQTFRGYWDYDGGGLGDMGQHYIDPVQYFLGKDHTSPVKVEVDAPQQHPDAVGTWRSITYTYEDGCQIVLWGGDYGDPNTPYIGVQMEMCIRISCVTFLIGKRNWPIIPNLNLR